MLEQLFGSRTRVKLLRLFLAQPAMAFYVREITRKIDEQLNSVRRELANLLYLGFVITADRGDKKYYQLNTNFILCNELKTLLDRSQLLVEQELMKRLKSTGSLSFLALTGSFAGLKQSPTDIVLVGKVDKQLLVKLIERFERELGHEINYTLMSTREYNERRKLGDKFLLTILNNPKIVGIDTTGESS